MKSSIKTAALSSYVNTAIRDYMKNHDESVDFPQEIWEVMTTDLAIFSPILSEGDQALASDFISSIRMISNEFPALSTILLTQGCYGVYPILKFGTGQQKERYLDKLVKGTCKAGLGFSESKHLNSLADLETYAIKTETGWQLSGEKAKVSNSSIADILLVLAKVKEDGKPDSYGFFIVETNASGVLIGEQIEKQGLLGLPLSSVTLDNVHLPETALLGGVLAGNAVALGVAEGAFHKGLEFARVKRGFGKRLMDVELHQYKFADLYNKICAADAYFSSYPNQIEEDSKFVARIKLYMTKVALEVTDEILRLIGPLQKFDHVNIKRYFKDAEIIENYGRSGNSIRKEIAERWLKE